MHVEGQSHAAKYNTANGNEVSLTEVFLTEIKLIHLFIESASILSHK